MPRMLGRYGASNLLVVNADDAKQHLVASHNTTVIRPSFQTMTEEERVVFSEIIVGYLTEGHWGTADSSINRSSQHPRHPP